MPLQEKINSGFHHGTTALDIVKTQNVQGKTAIVTGGYSGLGLEITRALSGAGVKIIIPARRKEIAESAVGTLDNVEIFPVNLIDIAEIHKFADYINAQGKTIDFVIANAGIMEAPLERVGKNWESQFATNHYGHFALITRLLPSLQRKNGARVVSVSSAGHHFSDIRWDDIHFQNNYDKRLAYGQSKTANILFAVQLDNLWKKFNIRGYSLHPGAILTPLQRHLTRAEMVERGWVDEDGNLADESFKTPEQGAATAIWAAIEPRLENIGGVYCEDCDIAPISTEAFIGVKEYAIDEISAERLWQHSLDTLGIKA